MIKKVSKNDARKVRHERVTDKVFGTSECPRLCVFRSNTNIYAQIIDDEKGSTLVSASSLDKDLKLKNLNVEAASNTEITISGCDKVLVGEFAANVRKVRMPEPYKGKGIRYKDEYVRRKEGKKAAK